MSVDQLFTNEQKEKLFANNKVALELKIFEPNFKPVVCLHIQKLGYRFLVTQLEQRDPTVAFCLCDKGNEKLTLEAIDLEKLETEAVSANAVLERDESFTGEYNLAVYAKVADVIGRIVVNDQQADAKELFKKFSQQERYSNSTQNIRKFKFDRIW